MVDNSSQKKITSQQKIGFIFLLVFAVVTVSLGILQLRNSIYGPFVIRLSETNVVAKVDEEARLKQIDTDRDGISDYEELFIYETSPYLPDTDSDGKNDKEEIDGGKDPLCPEGQNCSEEIIIEDGDLISSIEAPSLDDALVSDTEMLDTSAILQDPKQLRELLMKTGEIEEEQLNAITDEQLLKLVEEMMANSQELPVDTTQTQKNTVITTSSISNQF